MSFSLLPLAHALVARKDLPIPAWLFAWGASIVLIVSFFALSAAWRKPRFEEERWRPLGAGLSRALLGLPGAGPLRRDRRLPARRLDLRRACTGTEAPDRNFALTFLFVTAWLGFPLFSVIFGDVFRPFNPWRAVGRAVGGALHAIAGQRPAHLTYPERLGRWPAAIGLLAVVWLEVVYGASGGVAVGLSTRTRPGSRPSSTALYTLAMMALFGVEEWCERGEVFSVYFGMFSQLGCFGVRDGRLGRRRPLSASTHWATVPGSAAVVIASIATHQLRRRPGGRLQERHRKHLRMAGRRRPRPDHLPATRRHDLHAALLRRGRPRLPDRRARHGDRARRAAARRNCAPASPTR